MVAWQEIVGLAKTLKILHGTKLLGLSRSQNVVSRIMAAWQGLQTACQGSKTMAAWQEVIGLVKISKSGIVKNRPKCHGTATVGRRGLHCRTDEWYSYYLI